MIARNRNNGEQVRFEIIDNVLRRLFDCNNIFDIAGSFAKTYEVWSAAPAELLFLQKHGYPVPIRQPDPPVNDCISAFKKVEAMPYNLLVDAATIFRKLADDHLYAYCGCPACSAFCWLKKYDLYLQSLHEANVMGDKQAAQMKFHHCAECRCAMQEREFGIWHCPECKKRLVKKRCEKCQVDLYFVTSGNVWKCPICGTWPSNQQTP